MGLSVSIATGNQFSESARAEIAARHAMQRVMADVVETPFDQVAARFHGTGFAVPELNVAPGDPDGLAGEVVFDDVAQRPGLYRVTLRVRWRGNGRVRTLEAVHFVGNVRGDRGTPPPVSELPQLRVDTGQTMLGAG